MQVEGKITNEPWEALLDNINQGKVSHAILLHGSSLSILSEYAYTLASHILLRDTPEAQYKISKKYTLIFKSFCLLEREDCIL